MTIFDIPMQANDADATTVGDYLRALLKYIWTKNDRFSGKRPFGNSGWQYDIYKALIVAKVVAGSLDEMGYVDKLDEEAADKLIIEAIAEFGKTKGES